MRQKGPADQATRRRLIEVATRQFATFGFKHTTIRAISHEARANVAAVNYHFRDKLGLYREVLESAFEAVRETTARAIQAGDGLGAEDQLRAYIRVHCEAILSMTGPSLLQQLITREMQEPTPGLDDLVVDRLKPRFDYLFRVVGTLLHLPPGDPRIGLCAVSVHGLILMFRPTPLTDRIGARLGFKQSPQQITEHLLRFALAGIHAYRSETVSKSSRTASRPRGSTGTSR